MEGFNNVGNIYINEFYQLSSIVILMYKLI